MFNKEPKPIKITKQEQEAFQQLADKKAAMSEVLTSYGLEERLLWDGLKKKYKLDTLKFKWSHDTEKGVLEVFYPFPDWAKDRLRR